VLSVHRGVTQSLRAGQALQLTLHACNSILLLCIDLLMNPNGHDHDVHSSLSILRHLRGQHPMIEETVRVADVLLERSAAHGNLRKRKRGAGGGAPGNGGGEAGSLAGGVQGPGVGVANSVVGAESSINGYSLGGPLVNSEYLSPIRGL
jgi:hypothetical protein